MAITKLFDPKLPGKKLSFNNYAYEFWHDDHLGNARYSLLGIINKKSEVGGTTYKLVSADKKKLEFETDYPGYDQTWTFSLNGRFKNISDGLLSIEGKVKSVSGTYSQEDECLGVEMSKLKKLKYSDLLSGTWYQENVWEKQINKAGRFYAVSDQDSTIPIDDWHHREALSAWRKPKFFGGSGDDHLEGYDVRSDVNLLLSGGPGDDTISGGAGNDVIVGGSGHNILNGGDGKDRFVLSDDGIQRFQLDDEDQIDKRSLNGPITEIVGDCFREIYSSGNLVAEIVGEGAHPYSAGSIINGFDYEENCGYDWKL
jgi:hypothetical protein